MGLKKDDINLIVTRLATYFQWCVVSTNIYITCDIVVFTIELFYSYMFLYLLIYIYFILIQAECFLFSYLFLLNDLFPLSLKHESHLQETRPSSSGSSWSAGWSTPYPAGRWWRTEAATVWPVRKTHCSPSPAGCGRRSSTSPSWRPLCSSAVGHSVSRCLIALERRRLRARNESFDLQSTAAGAWTRSHNSRCSGGFFLCVERDAANSWISEALQRRCGQPVGGTRRTLGPHHTWRLKGQRRRWGQWALRGDTWHFIWLKRPLSNSTLSRYIIHKRK